MIPTAPSQSRHILTPTKLNRLARTLLNSEIGLIWLQAEISNFVSAGSGHWYFTLKDNKAQIRAAMFKQANHRVKQRPKEGDKVLVRASVSLYEPRGDYQLIIEHLEFDGEGALKRELELLKTKLNAKGLFDNDKKRAIPADISTVGVITSDSGAALHDVLSVLQRRAPDINVIIYPTLVQGELAPQAIRQALSKANQRNEVDILLLTRGGGSLEDLWAFNNEQLIYDLANTVIPVVSAVGHEIDFTLCDLVADVRAPTPSAAAELISPDKQQRNQRLTALTHRLSTEMTAKLTHLRNQHLAVLKNLQLLHPTKQLQQHSQHLDMLANRLVRSTQHHVQRKHTELHTRINRLQRVHPGTHIQAHSHRLSTLSARLQRAWDSSFKQKTQEFRIQAGHLHALSPLATLSRGYSITYQNNRALSYAKDVNPEQPLVTRFQDGEIVSKPVQNNDT